MKSQLDLIQKESSRIEEVYRKREIEITEELYAPWQPAEILFLSERKRITAQILHKLGKFPKTNDKCLEIGYGKLGWLADLISWGFNETYLYGIELDSIRAEFAKQSLPSANLKIGDATDIPWENEKFNFVVVSTVFSSILNQEVRHLITNEIDRVLVKDGVLIWYDLAVNNPNNSEVQKIDKTQLNELFPKFNISTKRVTLAPPTARFVAPKSFVLAEILNVFPFLLTHLISILIKK